MPLHACVNCLHFVSKGSIRCLAEGTEDVLDPAAGNRCGEFTFASANDSVAAEGAAEAVLGTVERATDPSTARRRWAELFGD